MSNKSTAFIRRSGVTVQSATTPLKLYTPPQRTKRDIIEDYNVIFYNKQEIVLTCEWYKTCKHAKDCGRIVIPKNTKFAFRYDPFTEDIEDFDFINPDMQNIFELETKVGYYCACNGDPIELCSLSGNNFYKK